MYLFFDTETTGLSRNSDHVVQVAWVLADESGGIESEGNHVIRPQGFSIPRQAAEIHGITTAIAEKIGKPLHYVLNQLSADAERASVIVAHNLSFDLGILQNDYDLLHLPFPFHGKTHVCTMKLSTAWCRLPKLNGAPGFKWPKLEELHYRLFGKVFDNAHDALSDVRACMRCYYELVEHGVIEPPLPKTARYSPPPSSGRYTPVANESAKPLSAPVQTKESQFAYKVTHPDPAVRISVASDKDCPEAIQLLLADDEDELVTTALARNAACTAKVFERLAIDERDDVAGAVAQNPSCPADILRQLYEKDYFLGEYIAENPTTPTDLLAELHWHGWECSEHPNFSSEAYLNILLRKAESGDYSDRCTVAEAPQCPAFLLDILSRDTVPEVRACVAANQNCPPDTLIELEFEDESGDVRTAACVNPSNPVRMARQSSGGSALLHRHHDYRVRMQVASNNSTPQSILYALALDPAVVVRDAIFKQPKLTSQIFRRLAVDPAIEIRKSVAKRNDCPAEIVDSLSNDRDWAVRVLVATNHQCNLQACVKLARDKAVEVRRAVASNTNCPAEALSYLASDEDHNVRWHVIHHRNCPPEAFLSMADDPDGHIRARVASSPKAPIEALRRLAKSVFHEYRLMVAGNPACPDDLLCQLAHDRNGAVKKAATKHLRNAKELVPKVEKPLDQLYEEVMSKPMPTAEELNAMYPSDEELKDPKKKQAYLNTMVRQYPPAST